MSPAHDVVQMVPNGAPGVGITAGSSRPSENPCPAGFTCRDLASPLRISTWNCFDLNSDNRLRGLAATLAIARRRAATVGANYRQIRLRLFRSAVQPWAQMLQRTCGDIGRTAEGCGNASM